MKKTFCWILIALVSGGLLGKFTFDKYENIEVENTFKIDNEVYALFYGTYKTEDEIHSNVINIDRFIYLSDSSKIDVYIAISKSKESIEKIKKIYDEKNINTSIKKININNDEFIQNLNEYEKLLVATEDEKSLLVIEKQILSCYDELVVKDE